MQTMDERAREIWDNATSVVDIIPAIAAALRAVEAETIERCAATAQALYDWYNYDDPRWTPPPGALDDVPTAKDAAAALRSMEKAP